MNQGWDYPQQYGTDKPRKGAFMSYQTLQLDFESRPGVARVTLNRPDVRNAFNDEVISELDRAFREIEAHPEVRLAVLAGEGKVFCAGGDLNWMKASVEYSYGENLDDTRKLAHLFEYLNEFPKPIIGQVHGAAIGGGVGLVSICDTVAATRSTVFSLSEVRLGIVPACIGPFVVSKIGASHARSLFVSADRFDGVRAQEIGLVHYVLDDESALKEKVDQLIDNMLQCGPLAMSVAKRLVLELAWPEHRAKYIQKTGVESNSLEYIAETLASVRVSEEGQEGVRAFLEKRKPSWNK